MGVLQASHILFLNNKGRGIKSWCDLLILLGGGDLMILNPFVSHGGKKSHFFMGLQSINVNYSFFSPIKGSLTEVS